MKFTINRNELLKGLLIASKIFNGNKIIDPILNFTKLELVDSNLIITSSNGDFSIQTFIPFHNNDSILIRDVKEGSILLDSKLFLELIRRLEGEEITLIVLDDTIAELSDSTSEFKLNCLKGEEFRDIDFEENGTTIELSSKLFIDAINEVAGSASNKKEPLILSGINLESDTSNITFIATDGARLAKTEIPVISNSRFSITVSAKTLLEITRSITTEETITFCVSDKKVLFKLNNSLFSSRLLGDNYPNVKNIVPKSFIYTLEVNSAQLINAMGKVSLLSSERENVVKLSMDEARVFVTSSSQQLGSGMGEIQLFRFNGNHLEISFNSEFVSNAIRSLKSEDVVISFNGEMKPFTITSKDKPLSIQLMTPVRTF